MGYRAVLFDLDGTLLDTLADLACATNRVMAKRGFPVHPLDAYRFMVGNGATKLVTRALPEGKRDAENIRACLEDFAMEYGRVWNASTRPYAGVSDLLDGLVAREVKVAVLSNKPDEFTQKCVDMLLPAWRFDAVVGAGNSVSHKPDPAGALEIANRLGIPPRGFLYLGDTSVDIKTALAAGMYPVGALWGFRSRQELHEAGAATLIDQPTDLLKLL